MSVISTKVTGRMNQRSIPRIPSFQIYSFVSPPRFVVILLIVLSLAFSTEVFGKRRAASSNKATKSKSKSARNKSSRADRGRKMTARERRASRRDRYSARNRRGRSRGTLVSQNVNSAAPRRIAREQTLIAQGARAQTPSPVDQTGTYC